MALIFFSLPIILQIDLFFNLSVWAHVVESHSYFSIRCCTFWFVQSLGENQTGSSSHTGEGNSMIHEGTQERERNVFYSWE